jgi:Fur family transcriptional regulator, ferric uptake regulator
MKRTKRPATTSGAAFAGASRRVTKQRRRIISKLAAAKRYMSAKELHAGLAAAAPPVGLATVYRTLETLRELGLVTTSTQPNGETAYLLCRRGHHHHAVCTQCGRVNDVPCRALVGYQRTLSRALRFRLTEHQLEFYGVCARCS